MHFFTLRHRGRGGCPHLTGPDQVPTLASGTPWPLSWAPVDEGRQEGMVVLAQLSNLSACLEGDNKKRRGY